VPVGAVVVSDVTLGAVVVTSGVGAVPGDVVTLGDPVVVGVDAVVVTLGDPVVV